MIAVIFELEPAVGQESAYLDQAAALKDLVAEAEGFISVERFQSLTTPGKLLSLSFWEDEAAVAQWRQRAAHRRAQGKGRTGIFAAYRLRVAQVLRDYGMEDRDDAPQDSRTAHG